MPMTRIKTGPSDRRTDSAGATAPRWGREDPDTDTYRVAVMLRPACEPVLSCARPTGLLTGAVRNLTDRSARIRSLPLLGAFPRLAPWEGSSKTVTDEDLVAG